MKKIREVKARLEAEAKKRKKAAEGSSKMNMTDPDSRIQRARQGYVQGYNAQVTVNEEQVILAHEVVSDENDFQQLVPMVEATEENLRDFDVTPKTFLADAGYCSNDNLERVSGRGFEFLISTKAERKHGREGAGHVRGPKPKGLREQMARKLRRPLFQFLYSLRGRMIEPVFGQLKSGRGLSGFLLRGIEKVRCEFSLWCSTHNLLKLYRKRLGEVANTA